MAKGRRKRVGDFRVNDEVVLKGRKDGRRFTIGGFPSRRTVIVNAINPESGLPSSVKCALGDIEKVV